MDLIKEIRDARQRAKDIQTWGREASSIARLWRHDVVNYLIWKLWKSYEEHGNGD